MAQQDQGKCSNGLQANVAAALSYALGPITGIVFYLIEKENKFVRFHAMQSIIVFGTIFVVSIGSSFMLGMMLPPAIVSMISNIIGMVSLALWVVLMIKAFQGENFKLPIAGDIAEKNS